MRWKPSRAHVTIVAALLALGLGTGYLVTRVPAVQRALILKEHRELMVGWDPGEFYGGWDWAKRSQLHQPSTGAWLLRDTTLVRHRIAEMKGHQSLPYYPYAGEWALMFAGLRLQGKTNREILAGHEGLTLSVATLVAEANPPLWWERSSWLAQSTGARPGRGFRLGLQGPPDMPDIMGRLPLCDGRQTAALVAAVLLHSDAFQPAERDAVLAHWLQVQAEDEYAEKNNVVSLTRTLEVRKQLGDLLRKHLGPPRSLAVEIDINARLSGRQRQETRDTLLDFLRSMGYQPSQVKEQGELRLEVVYQGVAFKDVSVKHAEHYTTTQRVAQRSYSRYGGGSTSYRNETANHTRWVSQLEDSEVPSLVVTARLGGESLEMALPPYGEFHQNTRDRLAPMFKQIKIEADQWFTWNWCVENYALAPWRFGLEPFRNAWSLEENG